MAARRLLFILLVMLIVSSVAAALVPVQNDEDAETESKEVAPAEEPDEAPRPSGGRTVERTVDAGRAHPPTVQLELGDRLVLSVKTGSFAEVEIPALGELADAEPGTPAIFDLIPPDPGKLAVRLLESGRRVATIAVSQPDRQAG